MVMDITGFGLIIPVVPTLLQQLSNVTVSEASKIGSYLAFTFASVQFICAPIIGNLSDQYGRRPIILASIIGFTFDYMLLAIAPTLPWLFVARFITGICGASITSATAYIADVSTPETRAKNFGLIGAAFGIGFILGPTLGGILGSISTRLPFIVAALISFANLIWAYFYLPESLREDLRRPFDWKRANPLGAFARLKKYPNIIGLLVTIFILYIGSHAIQSNWSYFTIEKFHWGEKTIGLSLGMAGLMVGLVQGGLVRWVNPILGDKKSVYFGMILYAFGMLLFAFASQSWMMFAILIPYCLGGIAGPALQSILSGSVPPQEQGEIQGLNTSIISLSTIVGPLLMNNVFYMFTKEHTMFYFPGAPFLLASVLFLLASLLAYRHLSKKPSNNLIS